MQSAALDADQAGIGKPVAGDVLGHAASQRQHSAARHSKKQARCPQVFQDDGLSPTDISEEKPVRYRRRTERQAA